MAAADYAAEQGPPPGELTDYYKTRRWGLPYAGGWMEQPAGWLDRMEKCAVAFQAMRGYQEASAKQELAKWRKKNPEFSQVVDQVNALRKELADRSPNGRS